MIADLRSSVDVTVLFRSCVKTIKMRNKALGIASPQSKIFTSIPSKFFCTAKDIQASINSHDILIRDHKQKYLSDDPNSLTDFERAYMDKVTATNLKIIDDNIRSLESEIREVSTGKTQSLECKLNIINLLRSNYLSTSAQFRKLKDQRQKKQKEKDHLHRLQRPVRISSRKPLLCSDSYTKSQHADDMVKQPSSRASKLVDGEPPDKLGKQDHDTDTDNLPAVRHTKDSNLLSKEVSEAKSKKFSCTSCLEEISHDMLVDLDQEERQALEEENSHLHEELMSNQEEVWQITRQVVELSKMQDILSENVEIQAHQIDEIHDTILRATDNIQEGNEQVREAMRRDAGFRVWIMFFLIVMSFTVLFLDWYNP